MAGITDPGSVMAAITYPHLPLLIHGGGGGGGGGIGYGCHNLYTPQSVMAALKLIPANLRRLPQLIHLP